MNEAEELLEELKEFDEGPWSCHVVCSRCGDKTEIKGVVRGVADGDGGFVCGWCSLQEVAP